MADAPLEPSEVGAALTISATFNGLTKSAVLSVQPPPNLALFRLTVDPPNVAGGSSATGTVTLTGPAPSGGADISLSDAAVGADRRIARTRVLPGDGPFADVQYLNGCKKGQQ